MATYQKVLFLDIDGVLNNLKTKDRVELERYKYYIGLDKKLLKLFLDWLNNKDYSIILSSTWRGSEILVQYLKDKGIPIVDQTENTPLSRNKEITLWLNKNPTERYAILDDLEFQFRTSEHKDKFVQTDYSKGVTTEDLEKVRIILDE